MNKKKQEVTLYVCATKFKWQAAFKVDINTYDRSVLDAGEMTIIPLSEVTVEIEIPDVNGKQLQAEEIKKLQAAIRKEQADSYVRVTAIEERIQSLMALECES